ncbi:zinc finger domain-containing protein [Streptomyces sp. enrichment culture]|uniref:zinc finger domain-containing protein n=1 Tax=Streptomyces sp. enrichment culture TaxID=1795815 RepID=UPI003F55BB79
MPDELRNRIGAHPARAIPCPHCRAPERAPCTTRTGRTLQTPHPARLDAYDALDTQENAT